MTDLRGKVALVTGAARERGIGRGIVRALLGAGCSVGLNDVAAQHEAEAFVDERRGSGARLAFFRADVSDRGQVDVMFDALEADLGPIDIVCSNAGVAAFEPLVKIPDATLDRLIAVNLTGAFNVAQAGARRLIDRGGGGRIVFTSSVHVDMTFGEMAVYGGTKHALRALTETMAIELGPAAITVNHVGPGWVRTDLNDDAPGARTEAEVRATLAMIPLGRAGTPSDIGNAVAYLCSEDASYVTGAFLRVDGGFVAGKY